MNNTKKMIQSKKCGVIPTSKFIDNFLTVMGMDDITYTDSIILAYFYYAHYGKSSINYRVDEISRNTGINKNSVIESLTSLKNLGIL